MNWLYVVIRWVYFRIAVSLKVNKLKRRLTNSGYSPGRVMTAVIRYRNMRAHEFFLSILRKQTKKAIKNCNTKVMTAFASSLTREEENMFSKILSEENPSIRRITVSGKSFYNNGVIITITP